MSLTTVQQIFDAAMGLLDSQSTDGTPVSSDTLADFVFKTPTLVTTTLEELLEDNMNVKPFSFDWKPIDNQLGERFQIEEFLGEDKTFEAVGSKVYGVEVDRAITIKIEEEISSVWTELDSIPVTDIEVAFVRYAGVITASDPSNKVRIRLTGATFCRYRNVFLNTIPFPSTSIPYYSRYFPVDMPPDFHASVQVIEESNKHPYADVANHKWEGKDKLYLYWYFDGNIRLQYQFEPVELTALSDTINIDKKIKVACAYKLAGEISIHEQRRNATYFLDKYDELRLIITKKPPKAEEVIVNEYGNFSGGGYLG
jgi:hypothetical protein